MKHDISAWYERTTHSWKPGYRSIYDCYNEHVKSWTYKVVGKEDYHKLESYIDDLVDFAAEIREHEPTWKKE